MTDALSLPNDALYTHVFNTPFGFHFRCRTCGVSLIGNDVDLRVHTDWHSSLQDVRFAMHVQAEMMKQWKESQHG